MTRRAHFIVAAAALVVALLAAWWLQKNLSSSLRGAAASVPSATAAAIPAQGASAGAMRAVGVEVAKVEVTRLVDEAQAVGTLRSRQGVMLRPEVSARVKQIYFTDGARVRKGELLVQFDDQLQQAQLQQAQAELSIAEVNHRRNEELFAQNFISRRSVDESAANMAVVRARQALAKAGVDRLKLVAPFDGVVGIRHVHPGDYLKDGADVVNIEDLEALYVDFRLPERFQTKISKGQQVIVRLDALPAQEFSAMVQAVDPLIDTDGRAISVRGCIDNHAMRLRPGMFARVVHVFAQREEALVVPEEALVPQGSRLYVYRVVSKAGENDKGQGQKQKVSERVAVQVGVRRAGKVEITQGLEAGDWVVLAGQHRLGPGGAAVRIIETAPPQASGSDAQDGGQKGATTLRSTAGTQDKGQARTASASDPNAQSPAGRTRPQGTARGNSCVRSVGAPAAA